MKKRLMVWALCVVMLLTAILPQYSFVADAYLSAAAEGDDYDPFDDEDEGYLSENITGKVTQNPDETEEPVVTEAPVDTEAPTDTEAPVETETPADTETPAETEASVATETPAVTAEPVVTVEAQSAEEPSEQSGIISIDDECRIIPRDEGNTSSTVCYISETTRAAGGSVTLPQNGKVTLTGNGNWQISLGGDVWVNIADGDSDFVLTYAKLKNVLRGDSVDVRCGTAETGYTVTNVTFTEAESVMAEQQSLSLFAAPMSLDRPAVLDSEIPVGDTSDEETYVVEIEYVFENGTKAADSWTGTIAKGTTFRQTVTSPSIVGYTPDYASVEINVTDTKKYTVTYSPAEVSFTVKHFKQNVSDDDYTLAEEETKKQYTEKAVGENLAKTSDAYEGFTALLYDTSTKVAADGSTVIEIYYDREYYLLQLDLDGGYGAEPVYARYGASIKVANPQKAGYTFDGWDPEIPNTMPAENTVHKAKWSAGTTSMTVVFWYENANDAEYSYAGSVKVENVAVNAKITSNASYKDLSFANRDDAHFTYNTEKGPSEETPVIVKGDGSSIVDVYFTRNTYTLTFPGVGEGEIVCGKEEHTHSDSCCKYGGTSLRDHWWHTDDCCKEGKSSHTHSNDCKGLKITAKYQADIHDNFPIMDGEKAIEWNVPKGCQTFDYGRQLMSIDVMPAENITFTVHSKVSGGIIWYYLETINGEKGEVENKKGTETKQFKLYKKIDVSTSVSLTYKEEFHDIDGFSQWNSNPTLNAPDGKVNAQINNYLYYSRNSYKLKFMNVTGEVTSWEQSVQYEDTLLKYCVNEDNSLKEPPYPTTYEKDAYVFEGWYTDPYYRNKVNENTKMPASDTMLYAHWVPANHTVKTWLTDKCDVAVNVGVTGTNVQTVPHRELATEPAMPVNGGYVFVGWFYKDGNDEKAFDFSMPITKDLDLYAKWSSNTMVDFTISYVYEENGVQTKIADDYKGQALADSTQTFEARTGIDLYPEYQKGYYPVIASHSITMTIDGNNTYTFVYVKAEELPYVVRYLEKGTEKVLHEQKNAKTSEAVITEKFEVVTGYRPDAYQKRLVLSATEANNVITFWYETDTVHAPVTIVHWTQNISGDGYTEHSSTTNLNAEIGQNYSANALTIPGFEYKKGTYTIGRSDPVESTGTNAPSATLTGDGLRFDLYYDRIMYPYEFKFLELNTGNVLAAPVTGSARYQAHVTQSAKTIPGYKVSGTENQEIVIDIEDPANVAAKNVKVFYYEEETVDIQYVVVGPDGCGTLSNVKDASVKVLTGTVNGSTPTAATSHKFDGWFKDAECKQPVDSSWVAEDTNKLTPQKSKEVGKDASGNAIMGYAAATYYAKFVQDTTTVTVTKKIEGNFGDKSKTFTFKYSTDNGATWKDAGEIGNGGSLTIENVQIGSTLKIKETNATGYTMTAGSSAKTEDETHLGFDQTSYIITVNGVVADEVITVTNTNEVDVDTGISLDSLPYILILAVVVLGAAAVVIRKRKNRDDD